MSPSSSHGGSQPITRGTYNLTRVGATGANSDWQLTWAFNDGDALLDLTAPLDPLPVVAGTYAVFLEVFASAVVDPDATIQAQVVMDSDNLAAQLKNTGPMAAFSLGIIGVTAVFYNPANSSIGAYVMHTDAGQTPDLYGAAVVQRLS